LSEIINKGHGRTLKTEETDVEINKRLNFDSTQEGYGNLNTMNTLQTMQTMKTNHSKEDYADFK